MSGSDADNDDNGYERVYIQIRKGFQKYTTVV